MTLEERIAVSLGRMQQGHIRRRIPADCTDADVVIFEAWAELRRVRTLLKAAADELETLGKAERARWFRAQLDADVEDTQPGSSLPRDIVRGGL